MMEIDIRIWGGGETIQQQTEQKILKWVDIPLV